MIFDRASPIFARWATLTARNVTWLTRAKKNLKYDVVKVLVHTASVQDRIIGIGEGAARQHVRLIEVQAHGTVYRYLTNALDLAWLPTARAVALYPQRWRVEDAFAIVKRLLGFGLFPLQRRKHHPNAIVDHRAVVRRVDRLDRCRRRSVGVTVRRSLSGNGLPQSVFRDPRGRSRPPPTRSIIWPTVPASSASGSVRQGGVNIGTPTAEVLLCGW